LGAINRWNYGAKTCSQVTSYNEEKLDEVRQRGTLKSYLYINKTNYIP